MILGDRCTRNCGFCSVESDTPCNIDVNEPEKIAEAAQEMGLKYVVITSVTRDDLSDGGASQFAATIRAVKSKIHGVKVEVLTPDFKGNTDALKIVLKAKPEVFNHNLETIERLYGKVRQQANYKRSLNVLRNAKKIASDIKIKSGLMLGLGETMEEVVHLFKDLREAGCDFLTVGQYLRPSKKNLPVVKYIRPEIFEEVKKITLAMGFEYVASGALVRSSMNAEEMYNNSVSD